ncbi:beta-glucosidase/6-phospho-beta-glucosidase/beta-galactosidase [Marinitoga piezophila KA3]|uniref:Beta-glucosidase/6-phospho-beta-glucosidase/beta-galactosidase n=1 Tax=Marinitoga piezophila (strain DSM 14283 / JCM 11233 / KA3) TaxID=443254 RepID=H2J7V1_MARPK|nr:beta-galactosidase BgaS [Marinitoga piezophila]AEX85442.1 beta-glucosidase/6-phospho-beta-glucosidase/beta-galactosidase [Marinitoga piezophila KA3]
MFKNDFLFGVSLSGMQFEMGSIKDLDDRTDWYKWTTDKMNIIAGIVSGDRAENGSNYWNQYEEDHSNMVKYGMNAIRIGVEWSRIFPESTENIFAKIERDGDKIYNVEVTEETISELEKVANMEAVEHYKKILKDLKNKGIHVILDLTHFSLPVWLHDPIKVQRKGLWNVKEQGWVSTLSVTELAKFAGFCVKHFDEFVDEWSSMNEPQIVSSLGYLLVKSGFPPAYPDEKAYKLSMINQAQAHARAYDVIKKYTDKPMGLVYSFTPVYPESDEAGDCVAKALDFYNFWFMDMITYGNVDGETREDMKNKIDFIGVNYYTRAVIAKDENSEEGWTVLSDYGYDCEPYSKSKAGFPTSEMGWEIYPEGIYEVLKFLNERYNLRMIVTENGTADSEDRVRPFFVLSHLNQIEKAAEEGIKIEGYLHWSLIDNFEWAEGFSKRFGLMKVDYETKKRTPRPSLLVYADIIKNKTTKHLIDSVFYMK